MPLVDVPTEDQNVSKSNLNDVTALSVTSTISWSQQLSPLLSRLQLAIAEDALGINRIQDHKHRVALLDAYKILSDRAVIVCAGATDATESHKTIDAGEEV